MLAPINKFLSLRVKSKFNLANLIVLSLLVLLFILPETAMAQAAKTETIYQDIITKTNALLSFLSALLWPMLLLIGALMDNELIFGSGAEERLLSIWVQFRDFANILFVLILIIAAFVNILSPLVEAEEKWKINKLLPKFIIGLILINFSFIGCKVVLDVANVITSAVFALPDSVLQQQSQIANKERAQQICKAAKQNTSLTSTARPWDAWSARLCNTETKGQAVLMENILTNFNSRNAAFAFAINLGKLHIMDLKKETAVFIKDFVVNSLFSLIMFVLYAVSFIILAIVLLERLVIMWVVVAFSPLIVAGLILKDYLGAGGGSADTVREKLQAAITAPIIIGLSMSVGYIMLDAFNSREDFYFDLPLGDTSTQITGTEDLRQMLIGITAAFIVWEGTKFATKNVFLSSFISDNIISRVSNVGKFLGSVPFKYIPAVPIPAAGGKSQKVSLSQLVDLPSRLIDRARSKYEADLNKALGGGGTVKTDVQNLVRQIQGQTLPKARETLAQFLYKGENLTKSDIKVISEAAKNKLDSKADEYVIKQLASAAESGVINASVQQSLATRLDPRVAAKVRAGAAAKVGGNDNNSLTTADKTAINSGTIPAAIKSYLNTKGFRDAQISAAMSDNSKRSAAASASNYKGVYDALK